MSTTCAPPTDSTYTSNRSADYGFLESDQSYPTAFISEVKLHDLFTQRDELQHIVNCEVDPYSKTLDMVGSIPVEIMKDANFNLKRLSELKAGWDLYDAEPLNPNLIESARTFMQNYRRHMTFTPLYFPTYNRGVQLEFDNGSRSLEIEFVNAYEIDYLKWSPSEECEEVGTLHFQDNNDVVKLLEWIN